VRLAQRPITLAPRAELQRPVDVPVLKAEISKLQGLGWQPTIPLTKTLSDTLAYQRSRV
jgi:nucleoside-diphosphate-sugar epimerase